MSEPRLDIVIPTHNRPELLARSLTSALGQHQGDDEGRGQGRGSTAAPVRVILADDGNTDRTARLLDELFADPLADGRLVHLRTGATEPWANWRAGAEASTAEFTSFLQDDDYVSPRYASRILYAFDYCAAAGHPHAVWFGRLSCATHHRGLGGWGLWYAGNGPMVPMPDVYGCETPAGFAQGQAVAPSMYLTGWSLSPALAYRNGPAFRAALRAMPDRCDIYIERMMPAAMAAGGGFIADPVTIGHWVQHDQHHLSRVLHADQPRQTRAFLAYMDDLLDTLDRPAWQAQFASWCQVIPPAALLPMINQCSQTVREGGASRHASDILAIAVRSLRGRVRPGEIPWRRRLAAAGRSVLARFTRSRASRPTVRASA